MHKAYVPIPYVDLISQLGVSTVALWEAFLRAEQDGHEGITLEAIRHRVQSQRGRALSLSGAEKALGTLVRAGLIRTVRRERLVGKTRFRTHREAFGQVAAQTVFVPEETVRFVKGLAMQKDASGESFFAGPRAAHESLTCMLYADIPGIPPLYSAYRQKGAVHLPRAPLLSPDASLERNTHLVFRWYESALWARKIERPSDLGRPLSFGKEHRFYALFERAANAFLLRKMAPASWIAYWLDTWASKPERLAPLPLVFSPKTITKPRGWFSGLSEAYALQRSYLLPKGQRFSARQNAMRLALLHEGVPRAMAEREALVLRFFPETFASAVLAMEAEVHAETLAIQKRIANGRWVW